LNDPPHAPDDPDHPGLALTMAVWGWIQLRALDKILIEQQIKTLTGWPIRSAPTTNFSPPAVDYPPSTMP